MPNEWRTIKSLVHKIKFDFTVDKGKGMAESFSREKLRYAPQKEGGWKKLLWPFSCVTPAGTSNEFDVQNEWEENTQHTHIFVLPEWLLLPLFYLIISMETTSYVFPFRIVFKENLNASG